MELGVFLLEGLSAKEGIYKGHKPQSSSMPLPNIRYKPHTSYNYLIQT